MTIETQETLPAVKLDYSLFNDPNQTKKLIRSFVFNWEPFLIGALSSSGFRNADQIKEEFGNDFYENLVFH